MASRMMFLLAAVMLSSVLTAEAQVSQSAFSQTELSAAKQLANREMRKTEKEMKTMVNATNTLRFSSSGSTNNLFRRASPAAAKIGEKAERDITVAIVLNVNASLIQQKLSGQSGIRRGKAGKRRVGILDNTQFSTECHETPKCNFNSKFRTIDGSCNNKNQPKWGQTLEALVRLLEPDYADSISTPRIRVDDTPLPSARRVSVRFSKMKNKPSKKHTHMLMQWGQFLDHDLTLTPIFSFSGTAYESLNCCDADHVPENLRKNCFPIDTTGDKFFDKKHNQKCMEFTRSSAADRRDCKLGAREQMNEITAYIDASNVYGSDDETAKALRTNGGTGAYLKTDSDDYMPRNKDDPGCFKSNGNPQSNPKKQCFHAGDKRANEQPNLIAMHTIWVRHHNKVVKDLKTITGNSWSDERYYQEARRIVGAQMQHITYNEFLPIVLGKNFMNKKNLTPKKNGYSDTYDQFTDASISNEFATAAYRFGHSLIQGTIKKFKKNYKKAGKNKINEVSFKPQLFNNLKLLQRLIRGLVKQRMQKFDRNFEKEIRNKLFSGSKAFGLDLVALNIQRGRDHGLPSYAAYRQFCGLGKVNKFSDFKNDIPSNKRRKALRKMYDDPFNVDLYVGGILETPAKGALVGRTFRCLIGEQFRRLKTGDRFYYETKNKETRFTKDQLNEIRKTTLARIICENTPIKKIQPRVFFQKKSNNKYRSCNNYNEIPALPDLTLWKA